MKIKTNQKKKKKRKRRKATYKNYTNTIVAGKVTHIKQSFSFSPILVRFLRDSITYSRK